jgi:hypothetical protein
MRLFGNRLSIISTSELIQYASCTNIKIRLDLCPCKELGKLVARVVVLAKQRAEEQLGVLVDDNSTDYFVAGRNAEGLRNKLERLLQSIKARVEIVLRDDSMLHLFEGGMVTAVGVPIAGASVGVRNRYEY